MQIKEDKQTREATDKLKRYAMTLSDRDVLYYEDICRVLEMPDRTKSRWKTIVNKARKELQREQGRIYRAVNDIGYRVVQGDSFFEDVIIHRSKKARSQFRRGTNETSDFDIQKVPDHQRRAVLETQANWENQQRTLRIQSSIWKRPES